MHLNFYHHQDETRYFVIQDTRPKKHIRHIKNGTLVEIHAEKSRLPEAAKLRIIKKVREFQPKTRVIFIDHDRANVTPVEFFKPDGSSETVQPESGE